MSLSKVTSYKNIIVSNMRFKLSLDIVLEIWDKYEEACYCEWYFGEVGYSKNV